MKSPTKMTRRLQPRTKASKARILLIDPHQLVRQGIAALISQQSDLMVCGEATDSTAALETIPLVTPDLVLLEITLKSGNGLELIRTLAEQHPHLPVLVLSMHEESLYAELALRSGAMGYVMKTEDMATLLVAMRRVLSGKLYLSDAVISQMLRQQIRGRTATLSSPVELLTERELQVFRLIGGWHRTKEIATELNLSVKTVEYHRDKIRQKLHLRDASELVRFATECATAGLSLSPHQDKVASARLSTPSGCRPHPGPPPGGRETRRSA